jgi:hypothetical protein
MTASPGPKPVPLPVTIALTGFFAVLVWKYLPAYGPLNFLYFCDIALMTTLLAMWRTKPLLASMGSVGILLPQTIWMVDYIVRLTTGGHVVDLTEYMFNPKIELFVRVLSFFHFWLSIILFWLVCRWGYDRRAYRYQLIVALTVLTLAYLLTDSPSGPAGNVNLVFGPGDGTMPLSKRGPVMRFLLTHRYLWVGTLMLIHGLLIMGPSHWLLSRFVRAAHASDERASGVPPA